MIHDVILGGRHQCIVFVVVGHFKDIDGRQGWLPYGGRHFENWAFPCSMLIGYKTKYFFATFEQYSFTS